MMREHWERVVDGWLRQHAERVERDISREEQADARAASLELWRADRMDQIAAAAQVMRSAARRRGDLLVSEVEPMLAALVDDLRALDVPAEHHRGRYASSWATAVNDVEEAAEAWGITLVYVDQQGTEHPWCAP